MRCGGRDAGVSGTGYGRGRSRCQVRGVDGDPVSTGISSPVVEVDDKATITHEGRVIRVE